MTKEGRAWLDWGMRGFTGFIGRVEQSDLEEKDLRELEVLANRILKTVEGKRDAQQRVSHQAARIPGS